VLANSKNWTVMSLQPYRDLTCSSPSPIDGLELIYLNALYREAMDEAAPIKKEVPSFRAISSACAEKDA